MLPSWCSDDATVLRAHKVVRAGREVTDWSDPERITLRGCSLQPTDSDTTFDGSQRNASASVAALICPHGSDVREGDRVEAGGRTWEVDGVPLGIRSPTGATSNLRVALREWRG